MAEETVKRLAAVAHLADRDEALQRARHAEGDDPEWAEFESQVTSGTVLPLRLEVSVEAASPSDGDFRLQCENEDVWVAAPEQLPELAEAVREIASKDFGTLSAQLRDRGVDVTADELAGMYVEVTLDETLREVAPRSSTGDDTLARGY
jgi:hypothetical protein